MTKQTPLTDEAAATLREQLAVYDAAQASKRAQLIADLVAMPAFTEIEQAVAATREAINGAPLLEPHLNLIAAGLERVRAASARMAATAPVAS